MSSSIWVFSLWVNDLTLSAGFTSPKHIVLMSFSYAEQATAEPKLMVIVVHG
jgi:hypothetical protein